MTGVGAGAGADCAGWRPVMRREIVSATEDASECETRKSMVFPVVMTETLLFMSPSRLVVTLEIADTGIISVPAPPPFTPVASSDRPAVITPAVSFPPEMLRGWLHSIRSAYIETFAFLPWMCEVKDMMDFSFMVPRIPKLVRQFLGLFAHLLEALVNFFAAVALAVRGKFELVHSDHVWGDLGGGMFDIAHHLLCS